MKKHPCQICHDTKHYFKDNVWKRCECLEDEIISNKYLLAGIIIGNEDLKTINTKFPQNQISVNSLKFLLGLEGILLNQKLGNRPICIQGSIEGPMETVIQILLRDGIDSEFKVVQNSMEDLIKKHFKEEGYWGLEEEVKNSDIFSVYFGSEVQKNVGGTFLQEIFRYTHKHKVYLILSTVLNYDDIFLKYGNDIGKLFWRSGTPTNPQDRRVIFLNLES